MPTVGYFPFEQTDHSVEAGWLGQHLDLEVRVACGAPSLNEPRSQPLPPLDRLRAAVAEFLSLPTVVLEGPGGFLWAALLRAHGFRGTVTVLPYVNPRGWHDVGATALYRRFSRPGDRVFLGSTPAASVYRSCGVRASVGEPYGIDDGLFRPRTGAAERVRRAVGIGPGRVLLFAGRAQPDKDLYRLLRVSLKARLLFPDLHVVVASHVVDDAYLAAAREQLAGQGSVHFVLDPTPDELADLYNVADVFVTASTSHFETFGRAPAEALACGSPAIAPRYDGFVETLRQPGGVLVDVELDPETGTPHVQEERLLRAVYEVLSSPRPPRREEVAAIARSRFGRSTTIRMLGYLVEGNGSGPSPAARAAPAKLPTEWRSPLAEIAGRDPLDVLTWFWRECEHERLAAEDGRFVADVRRSLCVGPPCR